MTIHGKSVPSGDTEKLIRFSRDTDGNVVRVFFHEELFPRFKRLYDLAEYIACGANFTEFPDLIEQSFEHLSYLVFEFSAYGWTGSVSIATMVFWWLIRLVKDQVSLGKFTYNPTGSIFTRDGVAITRDGVAQTVVKIKELPVEG